MAFLVVEAAGRGDWTRWASLFNEAINRFRVVYLGYPCWLSTCWQAASSRCLFYFPNPIRMFWQSR